MSARIARERLKVEREAVKQAAASKRRLIYLAIVSALAIWLLIWSTYTDYKWVEGEKQYRQAEILAQQVKDLEAALRAKARDTR